MTDLLDSLEHALSDRYAVERELGRGGMAVVFLAQDRKLGRRVALKVLRPELAASIGSQRFLREIEIAAKLTHPNILALHDCGEADGLLYYTMPFVEGESLRDRLNREKQLPIEDALRITREVADALGHAHSLGFVHRDIKPGNILFEAGHAVVSDFGIARAVGAAGAEHLTETGISIGTPIYMSPEQAIGEKQLDGRSDIYALGCVLYEMLAGEPPYDAPTAQALIAKKLSEPLPRISVVREAVPAAVEVALGKALARTAADRYSTGQQFIEALSAGRVNVGVRPTPPKRRASRPAVATAAVVAVLAVAALAGRYGRVMADPGPPPPDRPYTVLAHVAGSADSATREAIAFAFRTGLDASHVIQTVPAIEVERFLTLMDRPETTVLDPATARELAVRYGVPTVVVPRMDRVGETYVFTVRIEDVATGRLRAEASERAADADMVVDAVDRTVIQLQRALGESRAVLARREPLPAVMTPSLDALRKYDEGRRLADDREDRRAVPLLREAVALDTAFAEAWAKLWAVYGSLAQGDSSVGARDRALRFPERLTQEGRNDVRGAEMMATDIALWDDGVDLRCRGLPRKCALMHSLLNGRDSALNIEKRVLADLVRGMRALDPSRSVETCWLNPWEYALSTGRLEEWEQFLDSLDVTVGASCAPTIALWTALAGRDWDRADSVLRAGTDLWRSLGERRLHIAQLDAVRGRISVARQAFPAGPILELVHALPAPEPTPDVELTGRGWGSVQTYVVFGLRHALAGDTTEANRVLERLQALRDSGTSVRFEEMYGPSFALIEAGPPMRRGDWRTVIGVLGPWAEQVGKPVNDGQLIWWILAEAYTQLGKPDSATVWLEHLVGPPQHAGGVWFIHGLFYSAAHFKLGHLYAQLGNREEALDHYSAFLDAFTDPEPEYAWMVTEARAEVDRLGRGR